MEPVAPEFANVLRGYDRTQVDRYVASMHDWLAELTDKAQRAEAAAAECDRLRRRVRALEARLGDGLGVATEDPRAGLAVERAAEVRQRTMEEVTRLRHVRDAILVDLERIWRVVGTTLTDARGSVVDIRDGRVATTDVR